MDAAPPRIDVAKVRGFLEARPGVTAVHDLHVWAMSATDIALTAHLVLPEGGDDAFLKSVTHGLDHDFGISQCHAAD